MVDFQIFLEATPIIDYHHPAVTAKAETLAEGLNDKEAIARSCFEYVRDEIVHTGDAGCGIPTALCYQRLSCSEYTEGIYCLHGLNAVWLEPYGWYRIDARGNKEGVDARFTPPVEQLAFALKEGEKDVDGRFAEPLEIVVEALRTYRTYAEMASHFPDIEAEKPQE